MGVNIGEGDAHLLEGTRAPPKARTLGITIAVGYLVFVVAYLFMWEHLPHDQTILNRISWSSSDFVGLAATGLSLYTYYLVQRSSQSKDVLYLQRFVMAFKKAGFEPEKMTPMLERVSRWAYMMAFATKDDPATALRIEEAAFQIFRERYSSMSKLTNEEMYELFRSMGR
jgi:hypothetical protein